MGMEIQCDNLAKRYMKDWIFKDFDFTFEKGEIYAIQGHNGAGKSTLLKTLCGYLSPSRGSNTYLSKEGKSVSRDDLYPYLSFAAPYMDLIEELTALEMLQFHGKLCPFWKDSSINSLIELFNLKEHKNKEIRFFSSGMKQRLKLGLAIMSRSELLILDEPGTNLDKTNLHWFQELLDSQKRDRTVIIASNQEEDLTLCNHFVNLEAYKI